VPEGTSWSGAHEATSRGDWQEAYQLLKEGTPQLGPADLPLLAEVAYAVGHSM
jgi:hypothetical protein